MSNFRHYWLLIILYFFGYNYVYAQCPSCSVSTGNLVVNSNFAQGDAGFTSEYDGSPNPGPGLPVLWNQGTYQVGNDANDFHYGFEGYAHSTPFFGNFMVVNGANIPGVNVWCQTVDVIPGGVYNFATWLCSVNTQNPAQIQFEINGQTIGTPFSAPAGLYDWQQHATSWTAPSGVYTATICITNVTVQGGGNDFGLDDITFSGCNPVSVINSANAGTDQTICSGESVTIGEPTISNINYSWTANPYFNTLNLANPSFAMTNNTGSPISHTFILSSDSMNLGCITTDQVTITVQPNPTSTLPASYNVCQLPITIDAGNGATSYNWDNGEDTAQIEIIAEGNYSVELTTGNCTITDNTQVSLIPHQTIDLGPDLLVCTFPVTLNAPINNAQYLWNTSQTTQSIDANSEGIYYVTVTHNSCPSIDSLEISFDQLFEFTLPSSISTCTFPLVFDSEVVAETYDWSNGSISSIVTFDEPGNYTLTAYEGACSGSSDIMVNQIIYETVQFSDSIIICELPSTITTNVNGADSYIWSNGSLSDETTVNSSGVYSVEIIDNSCPSSDDVYVFYQPLPQIFLDKQFIKLCQGDEEVVSADFIDADTYFWENGSINQSITVSSENTETIYASNICGISMASVIVEMEDCEHYIFIPNAFTPNQDGVNDLFKIVTTNFKSAELWIYNRYGEQVFYSNQLEISWNGDCKNGDYYVEPEVFVYHFLGETILGKKLEYTGHVTAIR